MSKEIYVLGYDVGGTKIAVSLGTASGKLIAKDRIDNRDTYPDEILPQIVNMSRKMVTDAGLQMNEIRAFGISTPGPADIPNGIMTAPTNNKHWRNVPIRKYLMDALGIEGFFENDANCGALAELFFGAGRGCDDFIYLTMSTGIGAGIIAAGKLIRGTGFYGGEFGHTVLDRNGRQCNCGLKGCYEAYCGGLAIANHIREELKDQPDHPLVKIAGGLDKIDMIALEKGVRAGDEYSCKVWDDMCYHNGQAYGLLINTFNPKRIILGTIAWASGDLFLKPVREYTRQFCWKETYEQCEIIPCELRRDIGAYAGMAAALYCLKEKGEIA